MAQVKHKFLSLVEKAAVGKSSVAVNHGGHVAQQGYQVGIMDADIHGPNMPKMLGVEDLRLVRKPGWAGSHSNAKWRKINVRCLSPSEQG